MDMDIDQEIISKTPGVSKTNLYQTVSDLSSFGTRWMDSPGEKQAVEYLLLKMKAFADSALLEEFIYPHYTPLSSSVSLAGFPTLSVPSVGLEYAGVGRVKGRLAYAGEGREADFSYLVGAGHDLMGEIVLARSNRPYRVAEYAEKHGAIGVLIISDLPFETIRQITSQMGYKKGEDLVKFGTPLPGAIISRGSGEALLSLCCSRPIEIELVHESHVDLRKSWNIIGTVAGSDGGKEEIIIGAHYDTQLGIEGAWDNASGCAALIEILGVMAKSKPKRTLRFCAFGGEEIGLIGSTHYVHQRSNDLNKIFCYLNLDSTSSDTSITHEVHATHNMLDQALSLIQNHSNWKITHFKEFEPLDHEQDSGEFVRQGVDAIWTHEEGNPYFHTIYDRLELYQPCQACPLNAGIFASVSLSCEQSPT